MIRATILLLLLATLAQAQGLHHRVTLRVDSPPLFNRLRAVEAVALPWRTPSLAAASVAQSEPLGAVAWAIAGQESDDVWGRLIEEYELLLHEAGDAVVSLPRGPLTHSVALRREVHRRIAGLPPSALERYRRRVDSEAALLLARGKKDRQPALLRQLVDEMFCSRPAEEALERLGDLAFEQGHFDEALAWWQYLAAGPLHSADARLLYPHPRISPARLHAKQILALGFQGQFAAAAARQQALRRDYPEAAGALAGEDGRYADIVDRVLKGLHQRENQRQDADWPTFAGSDARNSFAAQSPMPATWQDGPRWRIPLPPLASDWADREPLPLSTALYARMAYHPTIAHGQVLLANAHSVHGYDLETGKVRFRYPSEPGAADDEPLPPGARPSYLANYGVAVEGDRAYARLGSPVLTAQRKAAPGAELVCLNLKAAPEEPRVVWKAAPRAEDGKPAMFEGTPLVRGGQVYVTLSWVSDRRIHTALACYDGQGQRLWLRHLGDVAELEPQALPQYRQQVLTLAGEQLIYASHGGAVFAVDSRTGSLTWVLRYPSLPAMSPDGILSPRGWGTCLADDGRVFVAPRDSRTLFCLDVTVGQILWARESADVVQLLGASNGRVAATTTRGLAALDAATGTTLWAQPSDGRLPPLGRGLLAGSWIFWPTRDPQTPLRAVTLNEGIPERTSNSPLLEPDQLEPSRLHAIPAGNLALGQGWLVVAGASELSAFHAAETQPEQPPADKMAGQRRQVDRLRREGKLADALQRCELLLAEPAVETHWQPDRRGGPPGTLAWALKQQQELRQLLALPQAEVQPETLSTPHALARLHLHPAQVGLAQALLTRAEQAEQAGHGSRAMDLYQKLARFALDPDELSRVEAGLMRCEQQVRTGEVLPRAVGEPQALRWRVEDGRLWAATPEVLICSRGRMLSCRAALTGQLRWQTSLPEPPGWVAVEGSRVFAATAGAVQAYARGDGEPLWTVHGRNLGSCRLAAGKLFALEDGEQILTVETRAGQVVDVTASSRLRPLGAGIGPHFLATSELLLAQASDGRRLWLPAGRRTWLADASGAGSPAWASPPVELAGRALVAERAGKVIAIETQARAPLWTFEPEGPTSLTGEPSQVFVRGGWLLALVARNHGTDLVKLDPADGKAEWSVFFPLTPEQMTPDSIAVSERALLVATPTRLEVRARFRGKLLFEQALPPCAAWRVQQFGAVAVLSAAPRVPWPTLPQALELPAWAWALARPRAAYAVQLHDAASGELLQRLPTAARGPTQVQAVGGHLLVAGDGQVCCYSPKAL